MKLSRGIFTAALAFVFCANSFSLEVDEKELETSELIKKADITVFRFEIAGENEFRICRL